MSSLFIGIDIGTTGTKVILLDVDKGVVASATRSSELFSEKPGFSESSLEQWLQNTKECIKEIVSESNVRPSEILGIASSGMVPAVVLLDENNQAIRKAILQNDARAVKEIAEIAQELRHLDFVSETGSGLSQQSVAPTLRWLQRHEPESMSRARYVVGSYDWILIALGSEPHIEQNWAIESGLFTLAGNVHQEILDAAGISQDLLPSVKRPGEKVGTLSSAAAAELGLEAGTALFVGGADHVLSAYSAGVASEGDWLIKLGGAGDVLVMSNKPLVDKRIYLDAHPIDGGWLPNGCMATSGSLIRWFQKITGETDLVAMDDLAQREKPATILCLPYFLGEKSPLHDPDLRGVFFGMHLGTNKAELYRSILEAIAFGFRHHRDIFRDTGLQVTRAMVTNGGSKSVFWKQVLADVLDCELHPVINHPGASLGAAVIAGVGQGVIPSMSEIGRFVSLGETVKPNKENVETYDLAYKQWLELNQVTTNIAHQLADRTRS
jgi:xylulokinase